jgi:hypothetical protein
MSAIACFRQLSLNYPEKSFGSLRLVRRVSGRDNIKRGAMNRLVALTLICAAALPTAGQTKMLVPTARVPSTAIFDSVRSFALPTTCDDKGNVYVKLLTPDGDDGGPLLMFSKTGVQQAKFDMSGALGFNVFGIRPKGGIAIVRDEQGHSVVNFGPDGKRESAVRLDPAHFFPSQLAIFPSGEMLLSGIQSRTREVPDMYRAYTAIYDAGGHLVKQLALDEDREIERAIEAGDDRYVRSPKQGNRAVTLGVALSGADGNVYLMRGTSPATLYVISSTGEVLRKLVVAPPYVGQMPGGMQISKNKLAMKFFRECTSLTCKGGSYTVIDAATGEKLAEYAAEDDVAGTFTCYASDPDRFFFLQMSETHRLEILETRPK